MILVCVLCFTLAASALADDDNGGCRCARDTTVAASRQYNCPRACFNDYVPVCGFNPCKQEGEAFRTFDNKCRQEATVCDGPGYLFYYIYNGTCDARTN